MRVTVATIVGLLAHGRTRQAVLEAYPYLDPEDLTEALADAARRAMEVDVEIGVPNSGLRAHGSGHHGLRD